MIVSVRKITRAARGGLALLAHERTIQWIFLIACGIVALGAYARLSRLAWAVALVPVIVLFVAEGMNTVVERVIDLVEPRYAEHIRQIKDGTAGVVLLAGIWAAVVWLIVFYPLLKSAAGF